MSDWVVVGVAVEEGCDVGVCEDESDVEVCEDESDVRVCEDESDVTGTEGDGVMSVDLVGGRESLVGVVS